MQSEFKKYFVCISSENLGFTKSDKTFRYAREMRRS